MEGEQFHIYLTDNVRPFRVNTPRSIPYAYCDLLQSQNILPLLLKPLTGVTLLW